MDILNNSSRRKDLDKLQKFGHVKFRFWFLRAFRILCGNKEHVPHDISALKGENCLLSTQAYWSCLLIKGIIKNEGTVISAHAKFEEPSHLITVPWLLRNFSIIMVLSVYKITMHPIF